MKQSSLRKKILLNIEEDRQKSQEFAESIATFLKNKVGNGLSGEEYSKIMMSAAKLMEVSSKANDQSVKLFETINKYKPKKTVESNELSQEELNQILNDQAQVVET